MHDRARLTATLILLLVMTAQGTERITSRALHYHTSTRGTIFAEEGAMITNPLDWPHIKYVIPDGVFVEKGQIITEFGRESIERRLAELRLRQHESQIDLENEIIQLHNREMDLRDDLDERLDDLAVLETRLKHLQSLPDPSDVEIAKGRLEISRLEYEAAVDDFETAKDRRDRNMISPAELDKYERAYQNKKAQHDYRQGMLEVASQPARASDLRDLELQIENVRLDTERLRNEIEENVRVSEIERRGAEARAEGYAQRVRDCEKDLEKTIVRAPIAGYVVYLPVFRERTERTGEKLFKNLAYLRIPDQNSLKLKGIVFERERRFFNEGDPVVVRTAAHPEEPLEGKIASFSVMPHDRGEKDEEQWLHESDSGIMVYDMVVDLAERPPWLRVGMTAACTLTATEAVSGPSVPASYVRVRDNEYYLSFDGVYRKVDGFLLDSYFVLSDRELEGRVVDWVGQFPDRLVPDDADKGTHTAGQASPSAAESGRFSVSGELVPSDTTDVVVGRIYRHQKVAWLIPEDSQVQKDDLVAKLDTADTDEEIKEQQIQLERACSRREREEEELKRRTRANEFRVKQAEKMLTIADLELQDLMSPDTTAQFLNARLNLERTRIRLDFLTRELQRVDAMTLTALSPLEVSRLRRDRKRAELQHEAAKLSLKLIEDGPEETEICRAELKVLERQGDISTLKKKLQTDEARYNYGLRRAKRYERWRTERVKRLRDQRENLMIKAPRDGLVRYSKVWNSGVWSKVHVGSTARHRTVLMTIADISRMYVRLEIPERYFRLVEKGMTVDVKASSLTDAVLQGTVTKTEFLFHPRRKKDSERGLYSSHEELGETIFYTRVEITEQKGVSLKPGAVVEVFFPFERLKPSPVDGGSVPAPMATYQSGEVR